MAMEIGGYETRTDWPKLGPSLLIATCLLVAIRTARWPAHLNSTTREIELDDEIEFAAHVSGRVFALLVKKWPAIFAARREPWYKADGDGHPE
jgi:hypothetical protein